MIIDDCIDMMNCMVNEKNTCKDNAETISFCINSYFDVLKNNMTLTDKIYAIDTFKKFILERDYLNDDDENMKRRLLGVITDKLTDEIEDIMNYINESDLKTSFVHDNMNQKNDIKTLFIENYLLDDSYYASTSFY